MLKRILTATAVLCLASGSAYAAEEISVTGDTIAISGTQYELVGTAFEYNGEVYMPLDEVLGKCGFSLGWDNALKGTVCENSRGERAVVLSGKNTHIIGYRMYRYVNPTINIADVCYINGALLEDITGYEINYEQLPAMPGTVFGDDFRYSGEVSAYPSFFVLDRSYAFESVTIAPENASFYAAIVNDIADKLPGVSVYNMLVPDSGEIYAPKEYYCSQLASFESIYQKLDSNVTPVRIADALYEHASENIYFRTDHHWTQRGAYYAWREFMESKGESVPELSEFKNDPYYEFKGSFASHIGEAFDSPYETMERFLPMYDAKVKIYNDMYMQERVATLPLVDVRVGDYTCFIGVDSPIAVIEGGVPNGKSIAIIKESCGNLLATWAVNNYEKVYVIDIRGFYDGGFDIAQFQSLTGFGELLIESYPTTVQSSDLRIGLLSLKGE